MASLNFTIETEAAPETHMQFSTIGFWVFFAVALCVYYLIRPAWRWVVLLSASLFFYITLIAPLLIAALTLVTAFSYLIGQMLAGLPARSVQRKGILWLGIILNLAVLIFIRYLPAIINTLPGLFLRISSVPNLGVSVGVSFFVFQAISYLIDVYGDKQPSESHFGYFSLYISFFPKLLQGPIERASHLLPQLRKPQELTDETIQSGLFLFGWGLFKKVAIADRLGIFVGAVYNHLPDYSGISLWLATFYYALQIYCDFSGYTDMAIGMARLLGINLSINFNRPYLAISIADFWRRWHISFSSWIFDYIFKPLQRRLRRWKTWALPLALLITFFLSGIWHGASWGFLVWGLLHGIYMAAYGLLAPYEKIFLQRYCLENSTWVRLVRITLTFLLVCFAWIFFRANTLADGWYVASHLFSGLEAVPRLLICPGCHVPGQYSLKTFTFNVPLADLSLAAIGLLVLMGVELPQNLTKTCIGQAFQKYTLFRWLVYLLLAMGILALGTNGQADFVYFKF
jgi:alginate O-acetyltransferase complex protein AlgI